MTPEDHAKAEMLNQMAKYVEAGNYRAATLAVQSYYARAGVQATSFIQFSPPDPAYPTIWNVRNVKWVGQQNHYFCGPASGLVILNASYPRPSRVDGYWPSQDALGNIHHMETYARGLTDWNTGLFHTGLNRWTANPKWYRPKPNPTGTETRMGIVQSVYVTSKPLGADTVEFAGRTNPHYNNHPTRTDIGHWIVAYAYSSPGDVLAALATWVDPAATVLPGFENSAKMFNYRTEQFANLFLNENGIVY